MEFYQCSNINSSKNYFFVPLYTRLMEQKITQQTLDRSEAFKMLPKTDDNSSPLFNYSLTITFNKPLEKMQPWQQFRDTIGTISRHIAACSEDFEIHPELTLKGRLHYHIRLLLKDKIAFYKKLIPFLNKCGYFDLGKTMSLQDWNEYCNKESTCMKQVLEFPYLPVTPKIYKNKIRYMAINSYYKNLFEDKISRANTLDKILKQQIKYSFDKDEDPWDSDSIEEEYQRSCND